MLMLNFLNRHSGLKEQQLIDELEADAAENPIEDDRPDEDSERKKLKRELQAEALARLEDAARTVSDFEKGSCLVGQTGRQQGTQRALSRTFPKR